jgi:hypothetical protein
MLTVALLIIAKYWKQSNYPSQGRWIYKQWHVGIMEYYLLTKRNDPGIHEITWNNLKCIFLSRRNCCGNTSYFYVP